MFSFTTLAHVFLESSWEEHVSDFYHSLLDRTFRYPLPCTLCIWPYCLQFQFPELKHQETERLKVTKFEQEITNFLFWLKKWKLSPINVFNSGYVQKKKKKEEINIVNEKSTVLSPIQAIRRYVVLVSHLFWSSLHSSVSFPLEKILKYHDHHQNAMSDNP